MARIEILGTSIDNLTLEEVLDRIGECIEKRESLFAVTPNVDHLMKLRKDPELRSIYRSADLVLADGVPLLWASRLLGAPLRERINGTDLFERLCEAAAERHYSVYLLGGNPGTAERSADTLSRRNPRLRVAGWHCPSVGFESSTSACKQVCEQIQRAHADILFVALGAPKQEKWIHKHVRATGVTFAIGIGISFSLVSGEMRRAPRCMQRLGFEWLWRLCTEPRRLWKRYLVDDMPFIALIGWEWLRRASGHRSTTA